LFNKCREIAFVIYEEASKKVGLEVQIEKTKYMIMSCHQNKGQNCNILIANKSFENRAKIIYLGMTVPNQIAFMKEL
jgi:hypothetical protein